LLRITTLLEFLIIRKEPLIKREKKYIKTSKKEAPPELVLLKESNVVIKPTIGKIGIE
jgi:hypothetical protein